MIEWWGSLGLITYQLSHGGDKLPISKRWWSSSFEDFVDEKIICQ
jgi:hypothetical protein